MKRIYLLLLILFISFCTKSQTFPTAYGGEFKFTFIENKKVEKIDRASGKSELLKIKDLLKEIKDSSHEK